MTAVALALGMAAAPAAIAAQDPPKAGAWDVMQARGKTRHIEFTTDQGTWMSTDISPDGRWILFDLLGNVYRVGAQGGQAEQLTRNPGVSVNYQPRYSPDGKTIVFVSDRSGQDNLWLMDADGGNLRPLLLDQESKFAEPSWSPDGAFVVVTRRLQRPGMGFIVTTDTVWKLPLSGAPEELAGLAGKPDVTEDRNEIWRGTNLWNGANRHQAPVVSPDGRYVYMHTSPYGGSPRRIQRLDLSSRVVEDVTETKDRYFGDCCAQRPFPLYLTEISPQLSPDGRWLAFARRLPEGKARYANHEVTGRTALWLRDLRTGEDKVVMDPITRDAVVNLPNYHDSVLPGYAWARDSQSIVLTEGGRLRRLWIDSGKVDTIPFTARVSREVSEMARAGAVIDDRQFAPHFVRWPQTSPDGKHLVFEAAGTLYLRSGGGVPRPLSDPADGEVQMFPAWSPDGRRVAFTSLVNGQSGQVWSVDVATGEKTQVTPEPGVYARPSFGPDGEAVLFDRWPAALTRTSDGRDWELASVRRPGGPVEVLARPHVATFGDAAHLGVRFYLSRGAEGPALHRLDPSSGATTRILGLPASVEEARLSPDGAYVAVQQYQDAYLAKLQPGGGDLKDASGFVRLTRSGARYLNWRGSVLEMASGGDIATYSPGQEAAVSKPVGLKLKRAIGRGTVVLKNARLLTMDDRKVVPNGAVVVTDGRIACVGECRTPAGAREIDLEGRTVMPGLMDMHAHAFHDEGDEFVNPRRVEAAAYLAYGVTTINDPAGSPLPTFPVADMVETGRMVGPRTFSTGYAMTCITSAPYLRRIETLQDALDHLDRKKKFGVLSIKDYLQCTRQQRQMLTQAARMRGFTVTNELGPLNYLLGRAMDGDTGWEHMLQYVIYDDVTSFFGKIGSTYDPTMELSDFSNGTGLEYYVSRTNLLTDPKAKTWTPWQRAVAHRLFVQKPKSEYSFPFIADGAARIKRAGGHVAVGGHGEVDGLGTHWEIWTQAMGMEPIEALESGTIESARFIGLERELGSIKVGKIADLIVLDRDPLQDIRNTMSLRFVMKAGRLFDPETLDEVWPEPRPYGPKPWLREDILRADVRGEPASAAPPR